MTEFLLIALLVFLAIVAAVGLVEAVRSHDD